MFVSKKVLKVLIMGNEVYLYICKEIFIKKKQWYFFFFYHFELKVIMLWMLTLTTLVVDWPGTIHRNGNCGSKALRLMNIHLGQGTAHMLITALQW